MTTDSGSKTSAVENTLASLSWEEIEAMYPPDPDIMKSPEHDFRGLRRAQAEARARREELDRKYPGYRLN